MKIKLINPKAKRILRELASLNLIAIAKKRKEKQEPYPELSEKEIVAICKESCRELYEQDPSIYEPRLRDAGKKYV
ncbi:MAG: hypothetical protein FWE67_02455 [Planctomycetaceae bacterium]|nr:hypothetical protein [Planctomycetaceae bacterium]